MNGSVAQAGTLAYLSRLIYPDPSANAVQTIRMAAALALQTRNTGLFVHDLADTEERVRYQYGVTESPLRIWPLHAKRWPTPIYHDSRARFLTYNSAIAGILAFHPLWRKASGQRKILFVRSRLELLYWGLMRRYFWWLRDWVFVSEIHDLRAPLEAGKAITGLERSARARRFSQALQNYDLVIAVTRGLADDIQDLTRGKVKPRVVPLSTGLRRLETPPKVTFLRHKVVLGYVGTVDQAHGVNDLFQAIQLLPANFTLRIIGRIDPDSRGQINQLLETQSFSARVELRPPIEYSEVTSEIDDCDILLVPAGNTRHSNRYRSPLKLFDCMARGKPIVAAAVPCHLELLQDGINACMYQSGKPADLARCIVSLLKEPRQAQTIAQMAWVHSERYLYENRARRILELINEACEPH